MFNSSAKVNPKQKSILFDAMLRHRQILEGRNFALRSCKNDLWQKLAAQLNMHGPKKDLAQWKKCLTDLRLAIRKRKLKSRKRRSLLIDRSLNDYGRQIVRACGIPKNAVRDVESSPIVDEVIDDLRTSVKEEETEEKEISNFEEVNVPIIEPAVDQDLMTGTIKIEDSELLPNELTLENESIFLSTDALNNERVSSIDQQTSSSESDATGGTNFQELYLMEILKESKKQTALLKKLIDKLSQ